MTMTRKEVAEWQRTTRRRHSPFHLVAFAARTAVGGLTCLLAISVVASPAGAASPYKAAALAQAKKSLLVRADMPKGWTSSKGSNDNTTPGAASLASCLGVPVNRINTNFSTADSNEFTSKNGVDSVDDEVEIFPSAKAAQTDFATGAGPKATKCLSQNFNGPSKSALESSFGTGSTVGTIAVTRSPAANFAPHTANISIFFPVTLKEQTINVEITEVVFVHGAAEQTVSMISADAPFPVALGRHLTTVADART